MEDANPDLDTFRKEWRAEVSARKVDDSKTKSKSSTAQHSRSTRKIAGPSRRLSTSHVAQEGEGEEEEVPGGASVVEGNPLIDGNIEGFTERGEEPRSALEHYEKAVEREAQGSLGDSLNLYRKAFRMDNRVDLKYKNKHFPPTSLSLKIANTNPSNASVTIPNPAHHSLDGPPPTITQTITELIAGFTSLKIEPSPPEIEGTPGPPCPLASLPEEILIHILTDLAVVDVASFARTALVCKRLAYLVATEEQIWKRVCLGSEVGFGAMHYTWKTEIGGGPIEEIFDGDEDEVKASLPNSMATTQLLLSTLFTSSWHRMFRLRPRIRFNGVYISTVNYIRPGQASSNQITWNSPVHIVTYYRYLRFFRDGTILSLCTTSEPADVVHYLTKEYHESKPVAPHLPAAVMQAAHKGRWRLATAADNPDAEMKDVEGDVYVETEGTGTKYFHRMELSLRRAGKGARNNKLAWKGFFFYNRLTDDWGEFGLKNDKAFFWSRVKSYGMGM